MLTTTHHPTRALILLACLAAPRCQAQPVEALGLYGTLEAAAEKCFDPSRKALTLSHGYLAQQWLGRQRLRFEKHYSQQPDGAVMPIQSAPVSLREGFPVRYDDQRVHELIFYPAPYARNFCVFGLCIPGLDYEGKTNTVTAQLGVARAYIRLGQFSKLSHMNGSYFQIHFKTDAGTWCRIRKLNDEWRLRVVLRGKVKALVLYADRMWDSIVPIFDSPTLELRDCAKPFLEVKQIEQQPWDPRGRSHDAALKEKQEQTDEHIAREIAGEEAKDEDDTRPFTVVSPDQAVRLSIEAEDFDDVPGAAGVQPFRRGFYGRERLPTHTEDMLHISGGRIVVCEHDSVPASMSKALDPPLPPGTYKVMFSTGYFRNRYFDNIFQITLGDETHEVSYWHLLGPDGRGWCRAPAFRVTGAATKLTIKVLQIGGGGRGEAPPYPKRMVFIDRFFVTNVMEDESPDRLARFRDEE